ncbi:MAG: electron transfer flavoprotein subunit alpha/FixB family protein [Spirochaetales bacterium]|uniref:Electron transfer flavoprotein subunit alpha/FixB family protein n=1 Tax=Candidatus Thalassospirochaeta sargassi TaxID=3119039 RepID=A0AAJ1I9T1_9SPIO|nr:electron transfer flavoprotein subunit alpha/FixB family protein [Spirochaetales bacterium]
MAEVNYNGVAVVIEQREGKIQPVAYELLGKARELADTRKQDVIAIIPGYNISETAKELVGFGADKVVVIDNIVLELYSTEVYVKAVFAAIKDVNPEIVLFGATSIGRDLAPRVSARVHTGLTADCTSLDIDEETGNLLMTRPAFGGNIMATIICPDFRPQMSTVRPGVMIKSEYDSARTGEVEILDVELSAMDMNVEILEYVKETGKKVNIEDATVLVSAGRGVGGPENIAPLEGLADQLGGEVSGSRAVIDAGWLPKEHQVGQTGKTVRPDLYFAMGISGQIQHIAGMEDSEFIIAVNKNPQAPIFDVADVGIVGDVHKVIPALKDELEALKKDKDVEAVK